MMHSQRALRFATVRVGSEIDRIHMWYDIRRISGCSWLIMEGSGRCQNKDIQFKCGAI
jgi:hypothetical protein